MSTGKLPLIFWGCEASMYTDYKLTQVQLLPRSIWDIAYPGLYTYSSWHISHIGKRTFFLLNLVLLLYFVFSGFLIVLCGQDGDLVKSMMARTRTSGRCRVGDLIIVIYTSPSLKS